MAGQDTRPDLRLDLLKDWLTPALKQVFADEGWGHVPDEPDSQLAPASSDASFRRYFRWQGAGRSLIVMDAPPPQEDCRPFVAIAARLAAANLHVPRIFAKALERGFLLLEDLGAQTYLQALQAATVTPSPDTGSVIAGDFAQRLFSEAIDALVVQQSHCPGESLPHYDRALLERELNLFPDWYLARHCGVSFTAAQQAAWHRACRLLVDNALAQNRVLVHRDFMVRNLMCSTPNPGVLDFQDAVWGPVSYDPVCLVKDAFISWTPQQADGWLREYWDRAHTAGIKVPSFDAFLRDCDLMGMQRHLKVIGIAARLAYRDGKPGLLEDAPRFFGYLNEALARRPELAELGGLLAAVVGMAKHPPAGATLLK